ncbi:potassium/proton antiporter [Planomicrobium sp. CPCC 101079]|uniref:potassium/proton antiporter n=1 Tax=Planomicrobium sp. CPCC 101079 TaxID=2599618 RepID=UPI0011B3A736|nr:potassium/proton antiporter [Planomicrobium sp. CPCC 101079]TWT01896.1 potassium/proton antiporter [Planomicrobium sp. CPCC 101079]
MELIGTLLFLISVMLIIGVLATKFSSKLGLPALILFLVAGMVLNRFMYFEDVQLVQFIGTLALIIILFDGGTQTKWGKMKPILGPASSLATLGVLLTTFITGVAAMYILDFSLLEGLLLGAIVGSTDAAAVFSVLGNKNFNQRLTATLEAESGSNDPMAVFLTVALIQLIQMPDMSIWVAIGNFFIQMGLGLAIGLLLGKISVFAINNIKLDTSSLYPILAMGAAVFTFAVTDYLGGSGLLAVYVMAVFVGNSDLTHRFSILRFNEGFAWMMQIIMFTLLGLLVFPGQLISVFWRGILIAVILMFIARPLAVFISMLFMKYNFKQKLFISWAGLKGAVPIVLATYPIVAGIGSSNLIFNTVFFVVLISALMQGSTLSWLAERLKLTGDEDDGSASVELINLGDTDSEIMKVTIPKQSPAVNMSLTDLTLPDHTLIIGITRKKKLLTPTGSSVIEKGDTLYVLGDKERRKEAKQSLLGNTERPKKTI